MSQKITFVCPRDNKKFEANPREVIVCPTCARKFKFNSEKRAWISSDNKRLKTDHNLIKALSGISAYRFLFTYGYDSLEKFNTLKAAFDLINSESFEDFLYQLERELPAQHKELYDHKILDEYDLLP